MRLECLFALLIAAAGAVTAAESPPVYVLLRGPNPLIQRELDQLPQKVTYDTIAFLGSGGAGRRTLTVARSGGIDPTEVIPILRAINIESEWRWFASPWRLAIHGDSHRARVVVDYCEISDRWLVIKERGVWEVLDSPSNAPPRCITLPPEPEEDQ